MLTTQEPLQNEHLFYRNWVKVVSGHYSEFQDLWEIVMIHSVICENQGQDIARSMDLLHSRPYNSTREGSDVMK